MKTGYSNLLGEYLKAEDIEYLDCQGFQVVCPACREPVFKVLRSGETGERALHYLAHYAARKSFATDCELRVGGIASGEVERYNQVSRGQQLAYFLGVLRQEVLKKFHRNWSEETVLEHYGKMARNPILASLRMSAFADHYTHREESLDLFEKTAQKYSAEVEGVDEFYQTAFGAITQVRIARDLFTSLLTPAGRENFYWLWNHAYMYVQGLTAQGLKQGHFLQDQPHQQMLNIGMHILRTGSRSEKREVLRDLQKTEMYPARSGRPAKTMLQEMQAEIFTEMVGSLIFLPYFDLLKEAKP